MQRCGAERTFFVMDFGATAVDHWLYAFPSLWHIVTSCPAWDPGRPVATSPVERQLLGIASSYSFGLADLSPHGLDWIMEVDGKPFADQNEFMAAVRAITIL